MMIQTNTTDRKALVKAMAEALGVSAHYEGVPTCNYTVGDFTVDRAGNITGDDFVPLHSFLLANGYISEEPATGEADAPTEAKPTEGSSMEPAVASAERPGTGTDERPAEGPTDFNADQHTAVTLAEGPNTAEEPAEGPDADTDEKPTEGPADFKADQQAAGANSIDEQTITIPVPDITVGQLRNLVFLLHSKQFLLNRSLGKQCICIPEPLVDRLLEAMPADLEAFEATLADCNADATGFAFRDGAVTMRFLFRENNPLEWMVYADLLSRIVKAAKEATRVHPDTQKPENEKFTFRSWLLRLGYKGADSREARRILMKNLKGNSAFPDDAKAAAHRERYAAIRRERRKATAGVAPSDSTPLANDAESKPLPI